MFRDVTGCGHWLAFGGLAPEISRSHYEARKTIEEAKKEIHYSNKKKFNRSRLQHNFQTSEKEE